MAQHTQQIVRQVKHELGERSTWTEWPGGWVGEVGTSLVDAVYSARAVYRTSDPNRGVVGRVKAWRSTTDATDSISKLIAELGDDPGRWAREVFRNEQNAPGRKPDWPYGPTKAAAILESATHLQNKLSVECAADVTDANKIDVARAMKATSGVGDATAAYFLMLLGHPGVKPDVMIRSFLTRATGRGQFTHRDAVDEIEASAAPLGTDATTLEHAIWASERNRR